MHFATAFRLRDMRTSALLQTHSCRIIDHISWNVRQVLVNCCKSWSNFVECRPNVGWLSDEWHRLLTSCLFSIFSHRLLFHYWFHMVCIFSFIYDVLIAWYFHIVILVISRNPYFVACSLVQATLLAAACRENCWQTATATRSISNLEDSAMSECSDNPIHTYYQSFVF